MLGAVLVQLGPLAFAPLRELLSLEPVSSGQLALAAALAVLPGAAVILRRRWHRRS